MTDARLIADPVAEAEAAVRANDLARAQDIAEAALARGVEHPMLLNLSAFRLESQGRLTQALQRLRRARELAPHDLPALNALGQCLARLERYPEAVEVFDDLLALNDKVAPAWFVRGSALDAMGDILAAEDSFARAVALKTDYAGPLAGLASLATRRGDHAEARRLGAAALAAEPGNSAALTAIAMAELGQNDFTGAEKRLRGLLADPRLALQQRVIAQGLLGDALHGQGRFAEAFAAYSASNEEERRLASPRFERSDADNPLQRARSVAAFVRAAPAEAWAVEAASGPAAGHAFVVGFPRSGTTLLETALAAHPRVVTLEERDTLEQGFEAYLRHPQNLARLADAPSGDLVRFRKAYWEKVEAEGADAAGKVFIDKLPLNTLKLPLIAKLFPDAKILFAVRDPRDVVLSCFRRRFKLNASMYRLLTLAGAAEFYDAVMEAGAACRERLPLAVHQVRYEDVVEDFETSLRAVLTFLDLGWDEAVTDFVAKSRLRGSNTPSTAQVSRGLYGEGRGQWRSYEPQLQPVMPALDRWLTAFGYAGD